jgi:hypothetical protein
MIIRGNIQEQLDTIDSRAVKRIFDLNASGVAQPDIPDRINSEFADANIGDSVVRAILHREVFKDVEIDEKILLIVQSRFKNFGPRNVKRRKHRKNENGAAQPVEKQEKRVLITNLMYARMQYERCRMDCEMAGMDTESLMCWLDIAVEEELLT